MMRFLFLFVYHEVLDSPWKEVYEIFDPARNKASVWVIMSNQ